MRNCKTLRSMKYAEFKELVIANMPKNPCPGLWQGKGSPRSHILGNPCNEEEKAELINKYSLVDGVSVINPKQIHLHQYAHHLNSSQIMCYNFFRPLMDNFDGKMYAPKAELIKLVGKLIDEEITRKDSLCNFEYIDNSGETTNFDFDPRGHDRITF